MKNLHVLPTDKPSRLMIDTIENKLYLQPILHEKTINVLPQHVYITSNEEIKEGDWFLEDDIENLIFQRRNSKVYSLPDSAKKIILTTDQDLINDNVQAIDNEFLEWFVKNPSCEEIEAKIVSTWWNSGIKKDYYKIIIPQEEPKTGYVKSKTEFLGVEFTLKDGSKQFVPIQSTLEEAAEKHADIYVENESEYTSVIPEHIKWGNRKHNFIEGAKYQAERMYSEEEVNEMFDTLKRNSIDNIATISNVDLFIDSWKRQFKK